MIFTSLKGFHRYEITENGVIRNKQTLCLIRPEPDGTIRLYNDEGVRVYYSLDGGIRKQSGTKEIKKVESIKENTMIAEKEPKKEKIKETTPKIEKIAKSEPVKKEGLSDSQIGDLINSKLPESYIIGGTVLYTDKADNTEKEATIVSFDVDKKGNYNSKLYLRLIDKNGTKLVRTADKVKKA